MSPAWLVLSRWRSVESHNSCVAFRGLTWHLAQQRRGQHRPVSLSAQDIVWYRSGTQHFEKEGREGGRKGRKKQRKGGMKERMKAGREGARQKVELNNSPERKAGTLQNGRKQTCASPLGNVGVLQAVLHQRSWSASWEYGNRELSVVQVICPCPEATPDLKRWVPVADTIGYPPSIHPCFFFN